MSIMRSRGISIVEIIIAVSMVLVILLAVSGTLTLLTQTNKSALITAKATYLTEESIELVRFVRDEDWTIIDSITLEDPVSLVLSTTSVEVVSGAEILDSTYERVIRFHSVYRNSDDHIVASSTSGAVVDPDARSFTVSVTETQSGQQLQINSLVTNLHDI